jgi:hypothetical protein
MRSLANRAEVNSIASALNTLPDQHPFVDQCHRDGVVLLRIRGTRPG